MAYISTDHVRKIRNELKEVFPDFKFSVRNNDHRGINVTVLKAPVQFIDASYAQLNHFYPENYENSDVLDVILTIINRQNWDNSQPEYDHFDIGFYVNVSQGKFDKPFIKTKSKRSKNEILKYANEQMTLISLRDY